MKLPSGVDIYKIKKLKLNIYRSLKDILLFNMITNTFTIKIFHRLE